MVIIIKFIWIKLLLDIDLTPEFNEAFRNTILVKNGHRRF